MKISELCYDVIFEIVIFVTENHLDVLKLRGLSTFFHNFFNINHNNIAGVLNVSFHLNTSLPLHKDGSFPFINKLSFYENVTLLATNQILMDNAFWKNKLPNMKHLEIRKLMINNEDFIKNLPKDLISLSINPDYKLKGIVTSSFFIDFKSFQKIKKLEIHCCYNFYKSSEIKFNSTKKGIKRSLETLTNSKTLEEFNLNLDYFFDIMAHSHEESVIHTLKEVKKVTIFMDSFYYKPDQKQIQSKFDVLVNDFCKMEKLEHIKIQISESGKDNLSTILQKNDLVGYVEQKIENILVFKFPDNKIFAYWRFKFH